MRISSIGSMTYKTLFTELSYKNSIFLCGAELFTYIIIVFVSVVQSKVFFVYHATDFPALLQATEHFFQGHTHWRAFQNRVAGPGIVLILQKILSIGQSEQVTYGKALSYYYVLITCAVNLIFFRYIRALRGKQSDNFVWLLAFIGFQILVWTNWVFPWDTLELCMITFLILGDLSKRKSLTSLYVLWFFWVFVKETAILVPIWLVLTRTRSVVGIRTFPLWLKENRRILFHAFLMVAITALVTKGLRDILFTESVYLSVHGDESHKGLGNFITIMANAQIAWHALGHIHLFKHPEKSGDIIALCYVFTNILTIGFFISKYKTLSVDVRCVMGLIIIYSSLIFLSALINEARVFLPFTSIGAAFFIMKSKNILFQKRQNT